jgi:hypothetical protein
MQLREVLGQVVDILLKKTTSPPTKLAVLLGHVVGVALRLKHKPKTSINDGRAFVESRKVGPRNFPSGHS